jgi:hypothetical protein
MQATGLIIGGKVVPCALPVFNMNDHGFSIVVGKGARRPAPKQEIDLAVWHWTGGEGSLATLVHVLHTRGYGVEFYICDGQIYQLADPVLVDAFGAGAYNPRAVSTEVQNYGFRNAGEPIPRNDRGTRPLIDAVQNGRKRKFAAFWDDDLRACCALADALSTAIPSISRTTPVGRDGKVYGNFIEPKTMQNVKGHVGHFQLSKMKSDPGPQLLQRFLDENVVTGENPLSGR